MNMTDEILNSWDEADELLADKIEMNSEQVNNLNDRFVLIDGSVASRNSISKEIPNGIYLIITQGATSSTARFTPSSYVAWVYNNEIKYNACCESSDSKITAMTMSNGVLSVTYANTAYHNTAAIKLPM